MSARYIAVQGQDAGTCESLRWEWMSIRPMVLAAADTEEEAYEAGVAKCGHDDVHVHDAEAP